MISATTGFNLEHLSLISHDARQARVKLVKKLAYICANTPQALNKVCGDRGGKFGLDTRSMITRHIARQHLPIMGRIKLAQFSHDAQVLFDQRVKTCQNIYFHDSVRNNQDP